MYSTYNELMEGECNFVINILCNYIVHPTFYLYLYLTYLINLISLIAYKFLICMIKIIHLSYLINIYYM